MRADYVLEKLPDISESGPVEAESYNYALTELDFFFEYAGDPRMIILKRKSLQYNQHTTSALDGS